MTQSLPLGLTDSFLWCEEKGYGWHSSPPMQYSGEYFANYQALDNTPMGAALTKARLQLVGKFVDPAIVTDIGIGGGRFVLESGGCGYDVSREAVQWLKDTDALRDPYAERVMAISCWDSLEHIPEPEKLLAQVTDWFFVSMPIYENMEDCLSSKHFKPGEHLHYWTFQGFVNWCDTQGFELREVNHAETELGREGITSFAFKRVA